VSENISEVFIIFLLDTFHSGVQINDATHGFGAAGSGPIAGDLRVYGRVYIGTA
jgi:hypothetical protein